ncbi:hypothetical protein HDU86_000988 [Geranomyces michiganensis]|nr:hypothetical protein HDU86_000988 [Geranomyces michiganensis]
MGKPTSSSSSSTKWESTAAVYARSLLVTACVFSFNGGIFAFFYPYASLSIWIAKRQIPAFIFNPVPLPAIIAVIAVIAMPLIEYKTPTPNAAKFFACALLAPMLFMQLTLIPAATFMATASVAFLAAACSTEPHDADQHRLPGGRK